MPYYRIRAGYSFRDSDGSVKSEGEVIELGDDVSETFRPYLDPVDADEPSLGRGDGAAGVASRVELA